MAPSQRLAQERDRAHREGVTIGGLDGYDEACVGTMELPGGLRVFVYDRNAIVHALMVGEGMSRDRANEFVRSDIEPVCAKFNTPVLVELFKDQ